MFGSKIRSWMENHIVRPRKKGNKNKNGNSGNLASTNTPNGHKGTSHQGDSIVGSPARRSEVSPIQNHATSRAGWQSPQDMTMSPHSDHFSYRQMVKTTSTSPKNMPRKSSYTMNATSGMSNQQQFSKSVDYKCSKTMEINNKTNISDNDNKNLISIPSSSYNQNSINFSTSSTSVAVTSATNVATVTTSNYSSTEATCSTNQNRMGSGVSASAMMNIENSNLSKNNSKTIEKSKNRHGKENFMKTNNKQQNDFEYQNGHYVNQHRSHGSYESQLKSREQQNCQKNEGLGGGVADDDISTEGRYGKILPTCRRNENFASSLTPYDNINANIQFEPHVRIHGKLSNGASGGNQQVYNTSTHYRHGGITNGMKGLTAIENNRNVLRANRYSNSSLLSAPGNHQLAHVINSLSSPESAYSTGYSTDGTSPGATYTPEYYINIRTGTHYFPKGTTSMVIESNRYKYGLNKIDEGSGSEMVSSTHRRTESCHLGKNVVIPPPGNATEKTQVNYLSRNSLPAGILQSGKSPVLQRNLAVQNFKGIESPSPRQRCRIRTNPWFSTADPINNATNQIGNFLTRRIDTDNSSTSSGIKSSSDAGTDEKSNKNKSKPDSSDSDSSSSTEIEVSRKTFSPNTIRKRKAEISKMDNKEFKTVPIHNQGESDDDATLNEMMGKFDESYVYEKETDILSDSDPTDCPSDLDTGQDADCDTDELLDIDFIDTGSIHEIVEKEAFKNTGSCSYHSYQQEKRTSKVRKSRKHLDENSSKRRKKLVRTRKKSTDRNHSHSHGQSTKSITPASSVRGCRSVGGTPVCLRRNQSSEEQKTSIPALLSHRSNSLTFTEIHSIRSRFLTIAESEKALIKADLEADVKYKQLIHEAETILVSMKTNNVLKETPTASPRRACNVPTNKRVEMLRNCEADLKRELIKSNAQNIKNPENLDSHLVSKKLMNLEQQIVENNSQNDNLVVNKRLEILRYETASAPNSPKACRFSPRKTHVTNFIQQNVSPTEIIRRKSTPDSQIKNTAETDASVKAAKMSPQLQLNGRNIISPPKSPTPVRRRFRSQSPRVSIDSESDTTDDETIDGKVKELNGNKSNNSKERNIKFNKFKTHKEIMKNDADDRDHRNGTQCNNNNCVGGMAKVIYLKDSDFINQNVTTATTATEPAFSEINEKSVKHNKAPLLSFRSVDIGHKDPEIFYCPQSEPLKRKIYTCSATYDKIQKSLDQDSEIPKKALLNKISLLRKERQAAKSNSEAVEAITNFENQNLATDNENVVNFNHKRQLIMNTIEDLKRSLEDQSVELCGLNDSEE